MYTMDAPNRQPIYLGPRWAAPGPRGQRLARHMVMDGDGGGSGCAGGCAGGGGKFSVVSSAGQSIGDFQQCD